MNREDMIRMVRKIADKNKVDPVYNGMVTLTLDEVSRLFAAEREGCATACQEYLDNDGDGQALAWFVGVAGCIDAIRARGES